MELSPCEKFLIDNLSDSDDSDVEMMLANFWQQTLVMALAVKEHEDENRKRRRGSTVGHLCIPRNRHLGNEMLMQDYITENPTYTPHLFRRRHRMRRSLFVNIVQACKENFRYFTQRRNVTGLKWFSAYQKISAAMGLLHMAFRLSMSMSTFTLVMIPQLSQCIGLPKWLSVSLVLNIFGHRTTKT